MNTRTVLVVDDEDDICQLVTEALQDDGHRVLCATGGAVLRVAEEEQPDVILLDIGMPVLDGVKLGQLLRAHPRLARTRIVIMSGMEREKAPAPLRYDAWLRKPFDLDDLAHVVTMAGARTPAA